MHLSFLIAVAVLAYLEKEFCKVIKLWYFIVPIFLGNLGFLFMIELTDLIPSKYKCCVGFCRLLSAILQGSLQAFWIVGLCANKPLIIAPSFLFIFALPFLRGFSCTHNLNMFVIEGLEKKGNYAVAVTRLYHEFL